jgi:putrescine transport system substrate-binding protein
MIDDEVKNDPAIYPTADVSQELFTLNAHSASYDRLLTRSWTRVKTGQ